MRVPLLLRNYRPFGLSIVGAMLLTVGVGNLATAATIPFVEDFNDNLAPDFTFSSGAALTPVLAGGVLTIDAGPNASGQAMNPLVNISNATGLPIQMDIDITPTTWISNGNSSAGFLAFSTNPAAGAFPSGANSGYLADIVFPSTAAPGGSIRFFDNAGVTVFVQSAQFAAGSLALNETYHLTFTATPGLGGVLDLSLTITDTTGTLIDGDGIVTISGSTPAAASTGTFFGLRHRVGSNGATSTTRTFDAVYDNFSVVPEPTALTLIGVGVVYVCGVVRRRPPRSGK
jgi:hypothetical protein